MGWTRLFLLGNIGQQLDIEDQRYQLEHQRREAEGQGDDIRSLVERVARLKKRNWALSLYLDAVIELLIRKGVCSLEEIETLVKEEAEEERGKTAKPQEGSD
jgi:hypothetical protein